MGAFLIAIVAAAFVLTPVAEAGTVKVTGVVSNTTVSIPWATPGVTPIELRYSTDATTPGIVLGSIRLTVGTNVFWSDDGLSAFFFNSEFFSLQSVAGSCFGCPLLNGPVLTVGTNSAPPLSIGFNMNAAGQPFNTGVLPTANDLAQRLPGASSAVDLRWGSAGQFGLQIFAGLSATVTGIQEIPTLACAGFGDPFDQPISLKKKVNRAIPLRMTLQNAANQSVTDQNIPGGDAPVVNVSYSAGTNVPAVDVTVELVGESAASNGNAFVYDPVTGQWGLNLSTKNQTAAGTYTVTVKPGSDAYIVSPSCTGTFVRQPN
jgi:hypothetical protein